MYVTLFFLNFARPPPPCHASYRWPVHPPKTTLALRIYNTALVELLHLSEEHYNVHSILNSVVLLNHECAL